MAGPAAWLEAALQTERDILFASIERRHKKLISKFEQEFQQSCGGTSLHPEQDGACSVTVISSSRKTSHESSPARAPQEDRPADFTEEAHPAAAAQAAAEAAGQRATASGWSQQPMVVHLNTDDHAVFASLYEGQDTGHSSRNPLDRLVRSHGFEIAFSVAILVNFAVMIFEAQYHGTDTGYELGYAGVDHSAEETFPGAAAWWHALDWVFGLLFTVELLLKLAALRREFPHSRWNLFDALIVGLWWVDRAGANVPVPPMILRAARMAKLVRLLRIAKTVQSFDSLFILTHSLKASVSATGWSLLLLFRVEAVNGVCLGYMLRDYIHDATNPFDKRVQVYKYFGTFTRCFLTMFELTLGNWIPATRTITENVNEWYMLLFLLHKLLIGFAVVRVISGVFLHQTFNVASQEDEAMMRNEKNMVKRHANKIQRLFKHADVMGDGFLDEQEFRRVLSNRDVAVWLSAMGLSIQDAEEAFRLLQKQPGGKLTAHDLVAGTARLKGNARAIDLVSAKRTIGLLEAKIDQLSDILLDPGCRIALTSSSSLGSPRCRNAAPAAAPLPAPPPPPLLLFCGRGESAPSAPPAPARAPEA